MKSLFLAAAGVFGAVPGLAVMVSGLGVPPGDKTQLFFGGVIEAFGTLAILLLWVNRNSLKKLKKPKVTKLAIASGSTCLIFLALYVILFSHCVVQHPGRGTAYYPLWTSGKLSRMVETAGSREAAIGRYGIDGVRDGIREMPSFARAVTTVVLLFLYQAIFTSLTLAFGIIGVHLGRPLMSRT